MQSFTSLEFVDTMSLPMLSSMPLCSVTDLNVRTAPRSCPATQRASPKAPAKPAEKAKVILVFDKGDGSKPKKFKIWNTDEFRKVFDVYRKSVKGVVSFSYLGAALNPNATPGDHGIETQGKIDVRS